MKSRNVVPLIISLGIMLLPSVAAAETVYLLADFNEKAIDQAIGTGGASAGEPVSIDDGVVATVRQEPMETPSLEIQDAQPGKGFVRFELVGSTEVTSGMVYIAADLWFDSLVEGAECNILIREQGGEDTRFAELGFEDNGDIYLHYGQDSSAGVIGQTIIGRVLRVIFAFDMDAGTFGVWLDGTQVVSGLEHGIEDRGVGSVAIGCGYDDDSEGSYNVDAIEVTDFLRIVPCETDTWGRIKARFR